MAEQDTTRPAAGKPGEKKIAGVPVLYWVVGAGAVVLGYLYFKKHSAKPPAGGGSGRQQTTGRTTRTPGSWSSETWTAWHRQHTGQPGPQPGPPQWRS